MVISNSRERIAVMIVESVETSRLCTADGSLQHHLGSVLAKSADKKKKKTTTIFSNQASRSK